MKTAGQIKFRTAWLLPAAAAAAIGVVAVSQLAARSDRTKPAEGVPSTVVGQDLPLFGGKFQIHPADYPVLGSQVEGMNKAVLLSDFTRPWCLAFHRVVETAISDSLPGTRIPVLPAATTPEAAEIQRIMLTVFHADSTLWKTLFDLVNSRQVPAKAGEMASMARCLMGPDNFDAAAIAHAGKIQAQLKMAASILAETGDDAILPKLVSGSRVLIGAESDPKLLLAFLRGESPSRQSPPRPVLALPEETVKLEGLEAGKPHDFSVKIQNCGDAPLQLGWTVLDEGCELTDLPKAALPPGGEASIGLRFKPPAAGGSFTRHLQIHSAAAGGSGIITLQGSCALRSATAVTDPAAELVFPTQNPH